MQCVPVEVWRVMLVCMCVGGGVEGYASVHACRWRCGGLC